MRPAIQIVAMSRMCLAERGVLIRSIVRRFHKMTLRGTSLENVASHGSESPSPGSRSLGVDYTF